VANKDKGSSDGTVASNRRAYHDYFIDDKIEAGIELLGPEVKSARARHVSLGESHAEIKGGEVFLIGAHMTPYKAAQTPVDPVRTRKLLLTRKEIQRLERQVQQKGYTLVPLRMYFGPSGYAKVELGLARGKKMFDKRETIAERDAERRTERAMADYNKRGAKGGDEG
jgi:SsrA-binding protein